MVRLARFSRPFLARRSSARHDPGVNLRASLLLCLILPALACSDDVEPGSVGTSCITTFDCDGDLVCFETEESTSTSLDAICMEPCEVGTRLCEGGEVCLADTSGVRVCYTGGSVDAGGYCTNSGDCEPGYVCIDDGSEFRCLEACDTTDSSCTEGYTCTLPEGASDPDGYCALDASE